MHGIETADERVRAGKPSAGTIALLPAPELPDGSFGFAFRDDGRGLDVARIRERAIASGFLARDAAEDADEATVAALVFLPGFTTSDDSPAGPARGLGLHLIERRVVDDCGGELTVDSHPGESCTFSFVLPERALDFTGALAVSA
jgi:chemotaxis protein histidine kinase CheA